MSRRFLLTAALSLTIAAPFATPQFSRAEETPTEIANAKHSALATINSEGVYVRSGAGDNYYPTTKLTKGTPVTVVGAKFDWLKIVPPQGSFCYVAKAFVDKNPDGSATINRDDVNVRAGSELNAMKTSVQSKLGTGQPVQVLGEVDEYYKIAPPPDAYVYVKKDYVDLQKVIPQVAQRPTAPPAEIAPANPTPDAPVTATPDQATSPVAANATTQPSITDQPTAGATATTKPAVASTETQFDKVEADYNAASAKPIEQQPINELTAAYQKLVADTQLPESMRRIADFRLQSLKIRADTRDQFIATQKQQNEAKQKQVALKAEQEEIAQQIKQKDVKVYTAVGTLRTSSLQQGGQTLYRLTDPQTGRTVCYLRSDDAKYAGLLGQFIGVRGELISEPGLNLKVVTATEWSPVDPNQLYRGVAAQVVPPSLLPQSAQQASATEK